MNIIWIRKSISEWISINLDEIKSFSYDNKYKSKFLYINHQLIVRDEELILFKALQKFMSDKEENRYQFDNSIEEYNIKVYNKAGEENV